MFGYVSIADLSADVRANLHRIPREVDLVVGVPRSGMIPAYMIGLFTNRAVIDLERFLANEAPGHGRTRELGVEVQRPLSARHILVVDDSVASGDSMRSVVERIRSSSFRGRITTCAAVVIPSKGREVDVYFREMPHPRIFEWNAFHHTLVEHSCFDLDGILCCDPTSDENDDGPRYLEFLARATPLIKPTRRIGHIVSARLEKYREPTARWLADHGISYGALHLIDLPSAAERIRLSAHCPHKARVYAETKSLLFYESDLGQARQIARLAGRPVLCIENMSMQMPSGLQLGAPLRHARWHIRRPLGRLKSWLRHQVNGLPALASRR